MNREAKASWTKLAKVGRLFTLAESSKHVMKRVVNSHQTIPVESSTDVLCFRGTTFVTKIQIMLCFELGSSPASMEAAKLLDAFGSQPGFSKAQADAIQAYIPALFTGVPTWLSLPRNRWPEHWSKEFWQPMVPLVLACFSTLWTSR